MHWYRDLSAPERKSFLAAFGGWSVDAFDYMGYTFLIPTLMAAWHMTKGEAGFIATATLVLSSIGGWLAGILSDRYGRVRVLQITIAWFSICTFLCGFTDSYWQLVVMRGLQGLGFGGEWAVGSVLIGEMIRAEHRGKAVGTVQSGWAVGWGAAAIAFAVAFSVLPEQWAWRTMFWLGILPALLILFIRRNVQDAPVFQATRERRATEGGSFLDIFAPGLLRTTVLGCIMTTGMMSGYYAVTTWVPTYLKTVRHLSVLNTSMYTFVIIIGSWFGFVTAAHLSDRLGRRNTFFLFAIGSATIVILYMLIPITDGLMLFLGFPLGFFLSGNFSGMGPFLTELFPSRVRGSGQGFVYNFGRGFGAFAPPLVGQMSASMPLAESIGIITVVSFGLVVLVLLFMPETRGRVLVAYD